MTQAAATAEPPITNGGRLEKDPKHVSPLRSFMGSRSFQGSISFLAFLAVFIGYAVWLGNKFASTDARFLDIHQNAPVLILGLAVLITLIAGQFDLSVGGMATLTTFLSIGL